MIGIAAPSDYEDIAALYAEAGYGAAVDPADLVIAAKLDAQLAGVGRYPIAGYPSDGKNVIAKRPPPPNPTAVSGSATATC